MTEQEERLARAWLALVGWRVGMVTATGEVVLDNCDAGPDGFMRGAVVRPVDHRKVRDLYPGRCLPALDSPANWGHWLAWAQQRWPDDPVALRFDPDHGHWARVGGKLSGDHASPAAALMECVARIPGAPPAVLDWWKHEQEATSGDS